MISDKVQQKINRMHYDKLEKLSNWFYKRYKNANFPPIARYITKLHYWQEEARAGLLW